MKNASTAFWAILLIGSLGMWGCAQQKNGANHTKIRDLESRYSKLEEDYRSLVVTCENHRKRLGNVEHQRSELQQEVEDLKQAVVERDELKQKLTVRTNERDSAQAQFLQFTKDLQSLVVRMETAANGLNGNSLTAIPTSSRKSE